MSDDETTHHVLQPGEVQPRDVVQLCMTGTTFAGVKAYLESHGLTVDPFPVEREELPTFMVGIGDALMRRSE